MKEATEASEIAGVAQEVERVTAALRTAIRLSGVSNREIERKLNMSTGYLTRILAGHVELRMAHVLSICEVIGLPPEKFLSALFPFKKRGGAASAGGLVQPHAEPAQRSDPEILVQELRESIDRLESFLGKRKEGS